MYSLSSNCHVDIYSVSDKWNGKIYQCLIRSSTGISLPRQVLNKNFYLSLFGDKRYVNSEGKLLTSSDESFPADFVCYGGAYSSLQVFTTQMLQAILKAAAQFKKKKNL